MRVTLAACTSPRFIVARSPEACKTYSHPLVVCKAVAGYTRPRQSPPLNVTEHNPAPSPSGHPLLSGPPSDIHQIFTLARPHANTFGDVRRPSHVSCRAAGRAGGGAPDGACWRLASREPRLAHCRPNLPDHVAGHGRIRRSRGLLQCVLGRRVREGRGGGAGGDLRAHRPGGEDHRALRLRHQHEYDT
jgi:hypothetical protein